MCMYLLGCRPISSLPSSATYMYIQHGCLNSRTSIRVHSQDLCATFCSWVQVCGWSPQAIFRHSFLRRGTRVSRCFFVAVPNASVHAFTIQCTKVEQAEAKQATQIGRLEEIMHIVEDCERRRKAGNPLSIEEATAVFTDLQSRFAEVFSGYVRGSSLSVSLYVGLYAYERSQCMQCRLSMFRFVSDR